MDLVHMNLLTLTRGLIVYLILGLAVSMAEASAMIGKLGAQLR
jgi:hypothetical protein